MDIEKLLKDSGYDLGFRDEGAHLSNDRDRLSDDLVGQPDLLGIDSWLSGGTWSKSVDLDAENPLERPSEFFEQLDDSQISVIQLAERGSGRKRRAGEISAPKAIYVTHEDYEPGAERDAFLIIYGYAENLFESNDLDKQMAAMDFFFCRHAQKITFEDAIDCLSDAGEIRIDVFRLRIMFELWVREMHFTNLPIEMDLLPNRIELFAATEAGLEGMSIAREVWYEPGIDADELIERLSKDKNIEGYNNLVYAYECLVDRHIISVANNKAYLTGKNPVTDLEKSLVNSEDESKIKKRINLLKNLHWSKIFW